MKPLSAAVSAMPHSGIREFMELAAQTDGVIHMEAGEPDFITPQAIIAAGFEAASAGFTKYSPNPGITSLREALVEKVSSVNGIDATVEQIVVTPGSVCALATGVLATVNPGDEVLIPDPGWPNYLNMVLLAGGRPMTYTLRRENGYQPDLDELETLVSERTKLIMINNPCNPTGVVFSRETVADLAKFAARHDLYVLADEIYEYFVFEGEHQPIAHFDTDGRTITVYGFSKTYAMTGWRLGYAVASPAVARLITRLQEPLVSCASTVSQKAAEAALRLSPAETEAMRESYRGRRDRILNLPGFADLLAVTPRGAFYALLDLSHISRDSYALSRSLLTEEGVATAPGETFGPSCAGMVRLAFTTESDLIEEGCRRILRYVATHATATTETAETAVPHG